MAPVAESRSHRLKKKHLYPVETLQLRCRSSCNRSMIDRHVPRACQDSTTPHVLARDNGAGWNPCDSTPAPGTRQRPHAICPIRSGIGHPLGRQAAQRSRSRAMASTGRSTRATPVTVTRSRRPQTPAWPAIEASRKTPPHRGRPQLPTYVRPPPVSTCTTRGAELLGVHFSHVLASRNYFTYRHPRILLSPSRVSALGQLGRLSE